MFWPIVRAATFLVVFTAIFVLKCDANLAAMSIDLGSQFMKIGLVKPGVPMEIVLNKDSRRKTPNIVGLRNGERFFGDVAAHMSVKFPANAITFSLDLIGKPFEHPIVAKYQNDFPHLNLTAHPERNTVVFNIDNKSYEAVTILAMMLWNAREQTRAFADQLVNNVVVSIPVYFNRTERTAVASAAKIAGFNLLSLISDGSAAALNYGVFRRKDISETAQTVLVYDVGATTTTATLVEYQLVDDKNNGTEKVPALKVLGVGFDRTTGGKDLTDRLRDHLVQEFRSKHKTTVDIATNPRAMAKLWKEAERVKQVLSANVDHFAQVESVFEDKDFKAKVSRDLIEEFVKDQWPLLSQPLKDALSTANFQPENVGMIVLMGAGTRVPSVQQILKDFFKGKELGRFLNTDEAIALGAVYEAARLSKGFRVKPFEVQDFILYPPIQVNTTESGNETVEENDYSTLSVQLMADTSRVLAEFERAERTKRDREAAFHNLESLVIDLTVRLDEDAAFRKTEFPEDLRAIESEVATLRAWLEDESEGAETSILRSKYSKLMGMVKTKKQKERKLREQKLRKRLAKTTTRVGNKKRQFMRLLSHFNVQVNKTSPVKKTSKKSAAEKKKHSEL